MLTEKSRQKQGSDWYYAHTTNHYNDTGFITGTTSTPSAFSGSSSAGASTGMQLYYTQTKNWKNGDVVGGTGTPAYGNTADNNAGDTSMKNFVAYDEDLGWRTGSQSLTNANGTLTSGWQYGTDGVLQRVNRNGSTTDPDVWFYTDASHTTEAGAVRSRALATQLPPRHVLCRLNRRACIPEARPNSSRDRS